MSTTFEEAAKRVETGADPREAARRLVSRMTLEEKLACLDGDTPFWEGVIDMIGGGYHEHPWPAAAVPRLGVPALQFSDGPRGVVVGHATAFPVSMARGASFDPDLEERIGEAIGRELRASGANFYGGVCVNLLRHPAWGRAQETYGEDPFHVGEMGVALARGAQRHVMACVKHYACNSMENARFKVDVTADERTLHEVYLPHFRRVVAAGVASVMSAYNSVNGAWCGENRALLTEILREEWGFDGFVISDFQFGLRDAEKSVHAGLDIEMPFLQQRHQHLPAAVAEGRVTEEEIDRSVERTLATFLRFAHVFESPPPADVIACERHRALAREAAEKSIVLLRNEERTLPLQPEALRRLAVVGRLAAEPNLGDGGSSDVFPPEVITPLDGLRAALPDTEILYEGGADLAAAHRIAAEADAVVLVAGNTRADEGEYIDLAGIQDLLPLFPPMTDSALGARLGETLSKVDAQSFAPGGDRDRLGLGEADEVLIETVAAANRRTIVALMGGSAILVELWYEKVAAIVQLWYPGMEGGHALADVLLGRVNPSGRLPFVVPTKAEHLPELDRDATEATYDLWHGQWKLDRDGHAPRFPFGYGLSYTSFAIAAAASSGDGVDRTCEVLVRNTGERSGACVVQVFGGLADSAYERPARRLLGFARVALAAGEERRVEIPISLRTLAVRRDGAMSVEPGDYHLEIGQYAGDPNAATQRVSVEAGDSIGGSR